MTNEKLKYIMNLVRQLEDYCILDWFMMNASNPNQSFINTMVKKYMFSHNQVSFLCDAYDEYSELF
jgi:hypothetical protein